MVLDKVFGSDIIRTHNVLQNNLYDILSVDPVKPLPENDTKNLSCDFSPKTDKYFVPKKKLKLKVRTVRDIRRLFENDIMSTLEHDLEKQQSVLFRKIRGGSSKDEKTKLLARNMFKSDKPISRVSWQMLINVNPNDQPHPSQYVLWNGKCIQVNGSRGGKSKFICKYDLGAQRQSLLQSYELQKSRHTVNKGLLRNSLNVKFRPGPLSRKKQLDMSYQKYNIGSIELVKLPSPGLDIIPEYGKALETSVTNYINALRDVNGVISDKWAEFAVSTLGKEDNGCAVQLNKDSCVTFDLKYKYDQSHLLMRYDDDKLHEKEQKQQTMPKSCETINESVTQEVKKVLDEMLISVEISLIQNNLYTGEDLPRVIDANDISTSSNHSRDKLKKHGELNRLDVTVIRLTDSEETNNTNCCIKSFCKLGCICDSLLLSRYLKNHCGRVDCMFDCKCDFSNYNIKEMFENEFIPGLINLDKEYNQRLSKEEQKFHQTVVLSGEKSILLKSQRRNWKAPKRYADFYSGMCLKTNNKTNRALSIVELKLNCANVEPWCMVHNLYKCFCKGKFTEKLSDSVTCDVTKTLDDNSNSKLTVSENQKDLSTPESNVSSIRSSLRPRMHQVVVDSELNECQNNYEKCARTKEYTGRKYSNGYYLNANKKILEMERNDKGLRKRMSDILNGNESIEKKKARTDNSSIIDLSTSSVSTEADESQNEVNNVVQNKHPDSSQTINSPTRDFISVPEHTSKKLKYWLEPILKTYRQRFSNGFFKKSLDPPRAGKVALYPWGFILERYRERKNFFLVTNNKPYRIYMAVDSTNALFDNCINISQIDDVEKYPLSIKKLIANEVDGLNDHLCILRGLDFCWELIGSVKKVCEVNKTDKTNDKTNSNKSSLGTDDSLNQSHTSLSSPKALVTSNTSSKPAVETITDQSKWFVMTLENDFSEIQFYTRGFFVKYDSIIKAIKVARASDKTVRLSSNKCADGSSDPQFGIYAIPNANEYCVFIGPYEKNEPLGIETVKIMFNHGRKRTRGVWITTNKVDNSKVIDNPLSFMPPINLETEQILVETQQENTNTEPISNLEANEPKSVTSPPKLIKILPKPIKISKTNNFYHLTSSGIWKRVSVSPEKQKSVLKIPTVINKSFPLDIDDKIPNLPLLSQGSSLVLKANNNKILKVNQNSTLLSRKPIAEIAPQVKVAEENAESNSPLRMLVLKPEEINKRSLVNKIHSVSNTICSTDTTTNIVAETEMNMDIENFLANSVECSPPSAEVYVISDDEDYCNIGTDSKNVWTDVGIVCNIENLGWIPGRRDANKNLSFEFPGFKYTEFYPEEEAMKKITQVLSRKTYVPKHLIVTWCVMEMKDLRDKEKLKLEDLGPNYVLTKQGLIHKYELMTGRRNKKMDGEDNLRCDTSTAASPCILKTDETQVSLGKNNINHLDAESILLDEESEKLLEQLNNVKSSNIKNMSNDVRQQISERLRSIISNANDT